MDTRISLQQCSRKIMSSYWRGRIKNIDIYVKECGKLVRSVFHSFKVHLEVTAAWQTGQRKEEKW